MALTPLPTIYNGYAFRSRLEARWAYYFDLSHIAYQYEPEGFILSDGQRYLPDFYLPDYKQYVEIKSSGDTASRRDVGPPPAIVDYGAPRAEEVICGTGPDLPTAGLVKWLEGDRDIDGTSYSMCAYGLICAFVSQGKYVFVELERGPREEPYLLTLLRARNQIEGYGCHIVRDKTHAKELFARIWYAERPKHFVAMADAEKEGIGFRVFWGDPREAKTMGNACAIKVPLFKTHADAARQKRFEGGAA